MSWRSGGSSPGGVGGGAPVLALLLLSSPATARVLQVGPGQPYGLPSAAAAAAQDGDTVQIAPGSYFDCAIWRADDLTIAGASAETTEVTDKTCSGKAVFVIAGNRATVRNLTLARARADDGNGAGIRAEGRDLTVRNVRFDNNQFGILAGGSGGFLRVESCDFTGNGASADGRPTHAVLAGALDRLRIETSAFARARGGDHVVTAAGQSELVGNRFADEGGRMRGPLIWATSGTLLLDGNSFSLATGAAARPGVALATGAVGAIALRGNTLTAADGAVPLLRNWSGGEASAEANAVPAGGMAVSDRGATWHRLRGFAAETRTAARHWAGSLARRLGLIR